MVSELTSLQCCRLKSDRDTRKTKQEQNVLYKLHFLFRSIHIDEIAKTTDALL